MIYRRIMDYSTSIMRIFGYINDRLCKCRVTCAQRRAKPNIYYVNFLTDVALPGEIVECDLCSEYEG